MKEIIVVDDGSTDNSRHIINGYGDQIIPVFQENRGVTSATNAGFFASRGEIIFLLDADDTFFPHKVETMVNYFLQVVPQNPAVMIFHRLEMTTDDGIVLQVTPRRLRALDDQTKKGQFAKLRDPETAYHYVKKWGFLPYITSPTSGLSLTRSLASRIFPLPEERIFFKIIFWLLLRCCWAHYLDFRRSWVLILFKGRMSARCFCWEAIWFSIRTLRHYLSLILGITKKSRLTKRENLLAKAKKRQTKQCSQVNHPFNERIAF